MGEQSTSENQIGLVSSSELPTTPEIAAEGVAAFRQLIEAVNDPGLRQILLNDQKLQACFLGIRPEIQVYPESRLFNITDEQWDLLAKAFEPLSDRYTSFFSDQEEDGAFNRWSIVNIPATVRIIKNNPHYFPPEAQIDPLTWMRSHPEEWLEATHSRLHRMRYGLISGFPHWDVEPYEAYSDVNHEIAESEMPDEEVEKVFDTIRKEGLISDREKKRLKSTIAQYLPLLPEQSVDIFLMHRPVRLKTGEQFAGFDQKRDEMFVRMTEELYDGSGMEGLLIDLTSS